MGSSVFLCHPLPCFSSALFCFVSLSLERGRTKAEAVRRSRWRLRGDIASVSSQGAFLARTWLADCPTEVNTAPAASPNREFPLANLTYPGPANSDQNITVSAAPTPSVGSQRNLLVTVCESAAAAPLCATMAQIATCGTTLCNIGRADEEPTRCLLVFPMTRQLLSGFRWDVRR